MTFFFSKTANAKLYQKKLKKKKNKNLHIECLEHKHVKRIVSILRETRLETTISVQGNGGF